MVEYRLLVWPDLNLCLPEPQVHNDVIGEGLKISGFRVSLD